MRKIVTLLKPFDIEQTVYIYQDGNKIDIKQITLDNVKAKLFNMVDEYKANQLDFIGGRFYAEKLVKEMQEQEMTKYHKNTLIFKII